MIFRRRPKWRLEAPQTAVIPGEAFTATISVDREAEPHDTSVVVQIDGKKESFSPQSEGLTASGVSATFTVLNQRITCRPGPVEVRLPLDAPPTALSTYAELEIPYTAKTRLEIATLPFHDRLLDGAQALGWRFKKGRVFNTDELQLRFEPSAELEQDKHKLVEVLVIPDVKKGTADVTVIGRRFPHGQFPVARATVNVERFAEDVREQLKPVPSPNADGAVVEGLISLLLRL